MPILSKCLLASIHNTGISTERTVGSLQRNAWLLTAYLSSLSK